MGDDKKRASRRATKAPDAADRAVAAATWQPGPVRMSDAGRAVDNIREYRAIPSPLYSVDYAMQLGGLMILRLISLFGLSRHGKSLLQCIYYRLVLDAGGYVWHEPLERGEDPDFMRAMLGPHYDSDRFIVPDNTKARPFSAVQRSFHEFCGQMRSVAASARKAGVRDWVGGLWSIDTLSALQFDDVVADVMRDNGYVEGIERLGDKAKDVERAKVLAAGIGKTSAVDSATKRITDRNYDMQWAQQVNPWMRQVNDLVNTSHVTGLVAAQCSAEQVQTFKGGRPKTITIYKPKGGRGVYEMAQMLMMVSRHAGVEDDDGVPSQGHDVIIEKNKGGSIPLGQRLRVPFYMRKDVVELDHARNLLAGCDVAYQISGEHVIEEANSYYYLDGARLAHGRAAMLRELRNDPGLFSAVEARLREHERRTRATRRGVALMEPAQ